jgi:DNA-binding NtrC family response regulator
VERRLWAMIAHDDTETRVWVRAVLRDEGFDAECATSCAEARTLLSAPRAPEVVFTGASLADGNWRDVLRMARNADSQTAFIVLTRPDDMQAYFEAAAEGEVDYALPPFARPEAAHIVRFAVRDLANRRNNNGAQRVEPNGASKKEPFMTPHEAFRRPRGEESSGAFRHGSLL